MKQRRILGVLMLLCFITGIAAREKVYMHFDQQEYYVGERIWFKAFVTECQTNSLAENEKVLYVELVAPEGYVVNTWTCKLEQGTCHGAIPLPDDYRSGFYTVRAYTRAMINTYSSVYCSYVFPVFDAVSSGDYAQKRMQTHQYRDMSNDSIWPVRSGRETELKLVGQTRELSPGGLVELELHGTPNTEYSLAVTDAAYTPSGFKRQVRHAGEPIGGSRTLPVFTTWNGKNVDWRSYIGYGINGEQWLSVVGFAGSVEKCADDSVRIAPKADAVVHASFMDDGRNVEKQVRTDEFGLFTVNLDDDWKDGYVYLCLEDTAHAFIYVDKWFSPSLNKNGWSVGDMPEDWDVHGISFYGQDSLHDAMAWSPSVHSPLRLDVMDMLEYLMDVEGQHDASFLSFYQKFYPINSPAERYTYVRGFAVPEEFSVADYSTARPEQDFRRTLYWNPTVRTDENGVARVSFYNNSTCRKLSVSAEWMGEDGIPVEWKTEK